MLLKDFADRLGELATAGVFASFGGAAQTLYAHARGDKSISFWMFVINIVLAFFVGNVVGGIIPKSFEYRDSILMICGFTTYPILTLLSEYGKKFAEKLFKNIDKRI